MTFFTYRLARIACGAALAASCQLTSLGAAETVSFDLSTATLDDLQKAMNAGAITSVELVNIYMERIAEYDQDGVKLNAVPALNPDALDEATVADARRAAGVRGPLLGVPFVIKGSIAAKELPLTDGINAWVGLKPGFDAFLVAQLRAAGAVFLGHANLDRFQNSASSSSSENWGVVKNAYVPYTTSGGSSGGPATATGANLAFFAIGCETGGSIRGPSDRAGIVGIKPSNGYISPRGAAALAADRDQPGPMARYAIDNAKILDVVSAFDSENMWNAVDLAPGRARPSGFAERAAAGSLKGKKIGVLTNYLTSGTTGSAPEINALFTQARADLQALGATVVEVSLPIKEGDASTYIDIAYTGRRDSVPADVVTPPQRKLYNPVTVDTTGNMVPEAKAYPHQKLIESIVASPTDTDAQKLAKVMSWINPVPTNYIAQAMKDAIQNGTTYGFDNPIAQEHFLAVRYQIADYEAWLASEGIDALIFPTTTSKTVGTNPASVGGSNTSPGRGLINSFSLPFITVPMGVIASTGEPSTIGFLGKYWGDAELMAIASAYEKGTKKRIVSPLAPALPEEKFEYTIGAPNVPKDAVKPVASVGGGAKVVGSGKKARLALKGAAADNVAVTKITVTINGKRVPARLVKKGWVVEVSAAKYRKLALQGVRTVTVVVVVKDASGNTTASKKKVKLPVGDLV